MILRNIAFQRSVLVLHGFGHMLPTVASPIKRLMSSWLVVVKSSRGSISSSDGSCRPVVTRVVVRWLERMAELALTRERRLLEQNPARARILGETALERKKRERCIATGGKESEKQRGKETAKKAGRGTRMGLEGNPQEAWTVTPLALSRFHPDTHSHYRQQIPRSGSKVSAMGGG